MSANNIQKAINKNLPAIPDKYLNLLAEICRIPATSANEKEISIFLYNYLSEYKPVIDSIGNIIIDKGKDIFKPVICAHLDTVHKYEAKQLFQYISEGHKYLFSKDSEGKENGIGGDDKCGILAALYLLEKISDIKIIFFTSEESGGIGSSDLDISELNKASCIIGVDRWGNSDYCNNYMSSKATSEDFDKANKNINKKYGYKATSGLMTDAFILFERDANVSCINVSCGYYKHHTSQEIIDTNELWNCCRYLHDLISGLKYDTRYKHEVQRVLKYPVTFNKYNYFDNINDYYLPGYKSEAKTYQYDILDRDDQELMWTIEYYMNDLKLSEADLSNKKTCEKLANHIFDIEGAVINFDDINTFLNYIHI